MAAKKPTVEKEKRFEVAFQRSRKTQDGSREVAQGLSFLRQMDRLFVSGSSRRGRAFGAGVFVRTPWKWAQRVVVKASVVSGRGQNNRALLKAHISYITRDSACEISQAKLYNEKADVSPQDLNNFLDDAASDRHHFRFIISPENAHDLDLSLFTRDLVNQMEKDLGTKLTYLAANHGNTDNPHIHLIIRGKDEKGKDLLIARDYLSHGIRGRASELATKELGHRSELEIRRGITAQISKERFTEIDRDLVREANSNDQGTVDLRQKGLYHKSFSTFKRQVRLRRLEELKKWGLASETSPGVWRLEDGFEATMREMGVRGDIIKTMHKALKEAPHREYAIFDQDDPNQLNITGKVVEKGLVNELNDKKYLIVSATDGRAYYVPLSKFSEDLEAGSKLGDVVTISVKRGEGIARKVDHTINKITLENGGIYSARDHLEKVSWLKGKGVAPEEYVENHVKRLEALERRGLVHRVGEKTWKVPHDFTEKLQLLGAGQTRNFVKVKVERSLQIGLKGPGDRELF
ncbi:DUF3363 domain-containing protein [Geomonas sp.]|uniref:DUF3363 domain-containing protein n=1 Tax=Geomonas sp. TaxID=2651584 RepID=UPI002B48FAEA|nr:DUF3363 domain-containing protein [Geomonas sp.]HJV33477.1 DUF3363 domain-containing protein [Geomonas sp.]